MLKDVTERNFMFFEKNKNSKLCQFYYLEPGLYRSITNIVETMNNHSKKRYHSKSCIKVTVSQRMLKVQNCLANGGSGLALFSMDLGHVFGGNVGSEFAVILRGKRPHKPEFSHDIFHIHSLKKFTDLIEDNIVADTQIPLLHCFLFISTLKIGDIITTGYYMIYQTFSNLPFRPLFKICFHSIHIEMRDTSGEEIPIVFVSITCPVLMFRKAFNFFF